MSVVLLGTDPALDQVNGQVVVLDGKRITKWVTFDNYTLGELVRTISDPLDGFWVRHSTVPPRWVESDDSALASAIADHYGCPIGRPDDWPAG